MPKHEFETQFEFVFRTLMRVMFIKADKTAKYKPKCKAKNVFFPPKTEHAIVLALSFVTYKWSYGNLFMSNTI